MLLIYTSLIDTLRNEQFIKQSMTPDHLFFYKSSNLEMFKLEMSVRDVNWSNSVSSL